MQQYGCGGSTIVLTDAGFLAGANTLTAMFDQLTTGLCLMDGIHLLDQC